MCKKLLPALIFTVIISLTFNAEAQTQFWADNFETAAPTGGTRTPSYHGVFGSAPHNRYFERLPLTSLNAPGYVGAGGGGIEGSQCWAAEDIDAVPTGTNGEQSPEQNLTWTGINIIGKTGLSFSGLFATGSATAWDHGTATLLADYLVVEYNIDGGAWVNLIDFRPNRVNATNGALAVDNNQDGLGDGTALSVAFTQFSATVTGTGTTMQLRARFNSNALLEEVAIDNFRLFETPACVAPAITANPPNRGICAGSNTTLPFNATGATAYKWQLNTGSGFTDISNGAPYSNATTATLTITGATVGMSGYTYRCVAMNGSASCFTNSTPATLTISSMSTTGSSQTNITCTGAATGSATVVPAGGISPYTYSWSPSGGSAATASGLVAGTYTVTVTDNAGCTTSPSFIITEPGSAPGSNSYVLPAAAQNITKTVNTANYVSGSCELINTIVAIAPNPVSGNVINRVWIEVTVPTRAGLPFVQRHYEITPTTGASSATATVTLYFTQTEFNSFNSAPGSALDLPTGPSDASGKANLRIAKYSGQSNDGTGLPSSYTGTAMVINPDDNKIVWNAVSGTWEVTFDVNGFSGFIVQTADVILPVSWVSFTAAKQNNGVLINWSTASEQNSRDFTVQHRNESGEWTSLAVIPAAGNSNSLQEYSYYHATPATGNNFYRVMQTDLDGKATFTEIKMVKFTSGSEAFTIIANPVVNGLLKVQVNKPLTLSLFSTDGKLIWKKRVAVGLLTVPAGTHTRGVYFLQGEKESRKIIIQ